jgi:hypothetical protein
VAGKTIVLTTTNGTEAEGSPASSLILIRQSGVGPSSPEGSKPRDVLMGLDDLDRIVKDRVIAPA